MDKGSKFLIAAFYQQTFPGDGPAIHAAFQRALSVNHIRTAINNHHWAYYQSRFAIAKRPLLSARDCSGTAMSFVALKTNNFDAMSDFYGRTLGFHEIAAWDRPNGRGRRFDLLGLKLEILDNQREATSMAAHGSLRQIHIVVEVDDITAAHDRLPLDCSPLRATSWGAWCFDVFDPDGVAVTFLE